MTAQTWARLQLAVIGIISINGSAQAANPAFPGAEGFGASAITGGYADVYHVTSLADTNTPGTLRYGIAEKNVPAGGRIIVFDVGGTIRLEDSLDIKNVSKLYIAGQTAPSPITIVGETTQITSSNGKVTSDVVLRYLTFRKGDGDGSDSVTFAGSGLGNRLILDHVSASWSEDENLSVANNNTNITVQYSFITEGLNKSNHAYGSLVRPRIDSEVSFHHNLYANNRSRNPRPGTYDAETLTFDFRNNVVYNHSLRAGYAGGSSESDLEFVDMNFVGNYVIAGPSTPGGAEANSVFVKDKNVILRAYQADNRLDTNKNGILDGVDNGWGMWHTIPGSTGSITQMASPFPTAPVITQSPEAAYEQVLNHAGNFWWAREAIDARIVNQVRSGTGSVINLPNSAEWNAILNAPTVTRPADFDSDGDGMPDSWEIAHGLNPNVATHNGDFDNDGYSDIEEYVNELGAFPAPRPISWTGGDGRFALNGNWDTWQPSRFDTVNVNAGRAVIDAVGQHAGTLRIGVGTSANGTVTIQSANGGASWLRVADSVSVGGLAGSVGRLELLGGTLYVGGDLHLNTTGTLVLGGGTLDLNGVFNHAGTIQLAAPQTINLPAVLSGQARFDTNGHTADYTGALSGTGTLVKTGTGTLRLSGGNTHEGGVAVEQGLLIAAAPGALGTGAVQLQGGDLCLEQGFAAYANNQSIQGLQIQAGSTLDVTTNVITLPSTPSLGSVLNDYIRNGAFNTAGPKILSSAGLPGRTVGIYDDGTTIRFGFAAPGDSDMDGAVTITDMNHVLSSGFTGAPLADSRWSFGDYDHDGSTTISDLNLVLTHNLMNAGPYELGTGAAMGASFESAAIVPTLFVDPATGHAILDTAGQALSGFQIQSRGLNGVISAGGDGDGYLTAGLTEIGAFLFRNSSVDEFAAAIGELPAGVYDLGQLFNVSITGLPLAEAFVLQDLRFGFNGDLSDAGNGVVQLIVPEPAIAGVLLPLVLVHRRRRAA